MQLSKQHISAINTATGVQLPGESDFNLPEKVLQFGTGVLLRGLPDYFIDKANKQGIFNGRIVVVKSTLQGGTDAFAEQDGLFTLVIRGIEDGKQVDETIVNSSISRVLAASDEWAEILACAANPEMEVVISNTTEVGLSLLDNDAVHAAPPKSFPGKLLAFLHARYNAFNGAADKGMVIVPTELITDNGNKLKDIVLTLAGQNNMDAAFVSWISEANDFCNSLVDRIVPGKLTAADYTATTEKLGFTDDLMIMSEVYRLWAIETTSERAKQRLSFAAADKGVVITPDINKFKELKLRLLNGSHTFTCGLAVLRGFTTVKEAMADADFYQFINTLMNEEIVPAILSDEITEAEAKTFAASVVDRYRNPYLEHQWLAITMQYTMKMRMRNVPTIEWYFKQKNAVPQHFATGFAAYLLFMQSVKKDDGNFAGHVNGTAYIINDQSAAVLHEKWQQPDVVQAVLSDTELWGTDLAALPGFAGAVTNELNRLRKNNA